MTKKHMRWGWLFVSPYIIGFAVFTLFAILFSGYVSFTQYDVFNPPRWIGFKNYIEALVSAEFWRSARNILTFMVVEESLKLFIACIMATLLNQKIRGMSLFRAIYFVPVLTPVVAIATVWMFIYNPTYGILNYLISHIGIAPFQYVLSDNWFEAVMSVTAMVIWQNVGYSTVYLLAGLQGISTDVLEAADIDGAGTVVKFFRITLPLLTPVVFFLLIVGMIGALQSFDAFYLMQKDSGADINVIGTLIYRNAFQFNKIGLASAIGWLSFVLTAVLTLVQKTAEKRWVNYA